MITLADQLATFCVGNASVTASEHGYRLKIAPTSNAGYTDAQLDNYHLANQPVTRFQFLHTAPCSVALTARFSHSNMFGTSGFGFWNHPFAQNGDVLAPPCNVWFFNASAHSDMRVKPHFKGHGFKAALLDSASLGVTNLRSQITDVGQNHTGSKVRWQHLANKIANRALRITWLAKWAMRMAQMLVRADEVALTHDPSSWHRYEICWHGNGAEFWVDEGLVLRTQHVPKGPLGFVAWVDNYYAIAAKGRYEFGYVACEEEQWMEIKL
jgi:hypothetical protein